MMKKERNYQISFGLLDQYSEAALANSKDLLYEAVFLFEHHYFERSIFLSCASIEESGKAYIAFSAKGRNLKDPSVINQTRLDFEDHTSKIISALNTTFLSNPYVLNGTLVKSIVLLSESLLKLREDSLYVDINDSSQVKIPNEQNGQELSELLLGITIDCYQAITSTVLSRQPIKHPSYDDKLYTLKSKKLSAIMKDAAFWEYLIFSLEADVTTSLKKILVRYHDEEFSKQQRSC